MVWKPELIFPIHYKCTLETAAHVEKSTKEYIVENKYYEYIFSVVNLVEDLTTQYNRGTNGEQTLNDQLTHPF